MGRKFSLFSLTRHALWRHRYWPRQWRKAEPASSYDIVIIGAGGHGLATAYYLAKQHNIRKIAILEKNWLGGGNTGRNTTIIRSNYLFDESVALYELSRSLYENLSAELNYNIMFSPRGCLALAHSDHDLRILQRIANANHLQGLSSRIIFPEEITKICPVLNCRDDARYPLLGALWQHDGGTARHDAVAWGYARGADNLGVDIIENCEVIGISRDNSGVSGVDTVKGKIKTRKIGVVAAGHSTQIMAMAGVKMPLQSVCLQALVSEPVKPFLDCVIMASTLHGYISQSDKGEMVIGGGADRYLNFSQRGSFFHIEQTMQAICELLPSLPRLRMLRQWGGLVDMTSDRSPIISKTPVGGLFVNCGWGTGGFKAIPGSGYCFANMLATGDDVIAAPFSLRRFVEKKFIDESVAAGVTH